jgi:hypothetical protein
MSKNMKLIMENWRKYSLEENVQPPMQSNPNAGVTEVDLINYINNNPIAKRAYDELRSIISSQSQLVEPAPSKLEETKLFDKLKSAKKYVAGALAAGILAMPGAADAAKKNIPKNTDGKPAAVSTVKTDSQLQEIEKVALGFLLLFDSTDAKHQLIVQEAAVKLLNKTDTNDKIVMFAIDKAKKFKSEDPELYKKFLQAGSGNVTLMGAKK